MSRISFFTSKRLYIVLGASNNPTKFGNKVLKWYVNNLPGGQNPGFLDSTIPVFPINPTTSEIYDIKCYKTPNEVIDKYSSKFSNFDGFSISVITPPIVSLNVLSSLYDHLDSIGERELVKAIWFQPGSYDDSVVQFCNDKFGLTYENQGLVYKGACILVSGASKMRSELKL